MPLAITGPQVCWKRVTTPAGPSLDERADLGDGLGEVGAGRGRRGGRVLEVGEVLPGGGLAGAHVRAVGRHPHQQLDQRCAPGRVEVGLADEPVHLGAEDVGHHEPLAGVDGLRRGRGHAGELGVELGERRLAGGVDEQSAEGVSVS